MSPSQLKQAPYQITSIIQGLRLYPAQHPQIQNQLKASVEGLHSLLKNEEKLTIGLIDGTLLINDIPCLDRVPALNELSRLLERQQLRAIEVLPGIDARQLLIFCQELTQVPSGEFAKRLSDQDVTAIRPANKEEDNEGKGAKATYNQAVSAIEDVCNDVRLGRIPSSRKAIKTTKGMVKSILDEPYALLAMSMLKDYDNYTFTHSVNVAVLSMSVGKACNVSDQQLYELGLGGLLHDLGKVTIDHQIVAKPGKLSRNEIEAMKQHPSNGARIVSDMSQIPPAVVDIVNGHHLRYDRTGYPANSRGGRVNPLADMTCIADAYDAMTTMRCYQRPRSARQAIERMKFLSGSQLHPEYVEKFLQYLGPYPVGTMVRLRNGSIGLICDQNQQGPGSLTLKIIFDTEGSRSEEPQVIDMPDNKKIVAEVDPTLKGINLNDYLP